MKEWIELMKEAKSSGLSKEEVKEWIQSNKGGAILEEAHIS